MSDDGDEPDLKRARATSWRGGSWQVAMSFFEFLHSIFEILKSL